MDSDHRGTKGIATCAVCASVSPSQPFHLRYMLDHTIYLTRSYFDLTAKKVSFRMDIKHAVDALGVQRMGKNFHELGESLHQLSEKPKVSLPVTR